MLRICQPLCQGKIQCVVCMCSFPGFFCYSSRLSRRTRRREAGRTDLEGLGSELSLYVIRCDCDVISRQGSGHRLLGKYGMFISGRVIMKDKTIHTVQVQLESVDGCGFDS